MCNRPVNIDSGEGSEQTQGGPTRVQNHLALHAGSGNKTASKLEFEGGSSPPVLLLQRPQDSQAVMP